MHTLNKSFHYRFRTDTYNSVVQGELNAQAFIDPLIGIYNGKEIMTSWSSFEAVAPKRICCYLNNIASEGPLTLPYTCHYQHKEAEKETVANLIAHTTVKTLTKAAETIVASNQAFNDELLSFEKSMIIRSQQKKKQLNQVSQFLTGAVLERISLNVTFLIMHTNSR